MQGRMAYSTDTADVISTIIIQRNTRSWSEESWRRRPEHYGKHPAIIGWQIDNELNCETCEFYSESDSAAFRVFLKEKYGTLDVLNENWGTAFWNQTYTDWGQIHVPRTLLGNGYNPHLHIDYYRFVSASTLNFCKMQAEIIAKYRKPEDFITTNGMFWNVDNHERHRRFWMYIRMIPIRTLHIASQKIRCTMIR